MRYGLLVAEDSAELTMSSPEYTSPPKGERARSNVTVRSRSRRGDELKAEEMDLPIDLPGLERVLPGRVGSPIEGDAVLGRTGILPERIPSGRDGTVGTAVWGLRVS